MALFEKLTLSAAKQATEARFARDDATAIVSPATWHRRAAIASYRLQARKVDALGGDERRSRRLSRMRRGEDRALDLSGKIRTSTIFAELEREIDCRRWALSRRDGSASTDGRWAAAAQKRFTEPRPTRGIGPRDPRRCS